MWPGAKAPDEFDRDCCYLPFEMGKKMENNSRAEVKSIKLIKECFVLLMIHGTEAKRKTAPIEKKNNSKRQRECMR